MRDNQLKRNFLAIGAGTLFAASAFAGDKACVIDDKCPVECTEFKFCDIFDKATLYKNEDNCLIQKVALSGRYHGHWTHTDVAGRPFTDDAFWRHRRFRLGAKVSFLKKYEFSFHYNVANNSALTRGDFFDGLEDMELKWKPDSVLSFLDSIVIGKMKNKITREESISSNDIKTIERSHFVNTWNADRPWGIEVGKKIGEVKHYVGFFTTAAEGGLDRQSSPGLNRRDESSRFPLFGDQASLMATYRAEYALNDCDTLHFDYQYSDWTKRDELNGGGNNQGRFDDRFLGSTARNLFSLGFVREDECENGFLVDLMFASDVAPLSQFTNGIDDNARNSFGFTVLGHRFLDRCKRLELVGRWAYATLVDDEGPFDNIRGPGAVNSSWLQDLHTVYLGLNYYICGGNLKLMAGVEQALGTSELPGGIGTTDYEATNFSIGVRTKW